MIVQSCKQITIAQNGAYTCEEDLRVPSATWTYLINDDPFEHKFGMLMVANAGISAWAALLWPLTALMLLMGKRRDKAKPNRAGQG